jgi:CheY-like chemotaxis protein
MTNAPDRDRHFCTNTDQGSMYPVWWLRAVQKTIPLVTGCVDGVSMTLPAKILVVDDDVETRLLLGEELIDLGHESVYAADGLQALTLARREKPDLILLDLLLPGGDGFTVLERLRHIAEVASIPVIVFSGMRAPEAEERALMLGAREFVLKSFRGNDLVDAIARALDRGPAQDADVDVDVSPSGPMPALRAGPRSDG